MRLRLPDLCVYWAPNGTDGFGKPKYAAPVQVSCRWEDKVVQTLNPQGQMVLAGAQVLLMEEVQVAGLMLFGSITQLGNPTFNSTNLKGNPGVREILNRGRAGNIKGMGRNSLAYLV